MAAKIKAVIFDLGRVVVDFDHWIAAKKVSAISDKNPKELYGLFFDSRLVQRFEAGKISPRDFFRKVKKALGLKISFEEFIPLWNEIFFQSAANRQVYRLAKQLRSRYTVALLSNINALHFAYLKKNFSVFDAFDQIFASCKIGYVKPHPRIYQKVLDKLEVAAGEAFYVDDRKELIREAKKLGIRGFVFKGVKKLKRDLLNCGVVGPR